MRMIGVVLAVLAVLLGGLAAPSLADVIYVNRAATEPGDGSSWAHAYAKITDAIPHAGAGDAIWVAAGTYKENLVSANGLAIPSNVQLLGGFNGTEADASQRNPAVNFTSIDGQGLGTTVELDTNSGPNTLIDGFHIKGGNAGSGGGVWVGNNSTGVISNNVISENTAHSGGGITASASGPTIANNLIANNVGDPGGIYSFAYNASNPTVTIVNNTITGNSPDVEGRFAVEFYGPLHAVVKNNIVAGNARGVRGDGTATADFYNNDISGNGDLNIYILADPTGSNGNINQDPLFLNPAADDFRLGPGSPANNAGLNTGVVGALDLDNTPRIQDNTVDMGAYETGTTDLRLVFSTQPAGGSAGAAFGAQPVVQVSDANGGPLSGYTGPITLAIDPGSAPAGVTLGGTLTVNAVDGVATFTDISVSGNATGVVLDATANDALPAQSRMFDVVSVRLYVSKTGKDTNDGSDWAHAKLTITGALPPAVPTATELWIAKGTYAENITVSKTVALYGGFAGTEANLTDRNLAANPTVLDGGSAGPVITSAAGSALQTIDGFTLQHGKATGGDGGGAALTGFRGTITNTTFAGNSATGNGGGLYISSMGINANFTIVMSNNTFTGNAAGQGGGLYLDATNNGNAVVAITQDNDTFSGNTAVSGGGAYTKGSETLANCHFTGNTASVGGGLYQTETIVANSCVFTNNGIANSTVDAAGGGVYSGENAGLQFNFGQFQNNHVSAVAGKAAVGGAWGALNNGSLVLYSSTMTSNAAANGGAIYGHHAGNVNAIACTLSGNAATGNGGGVYITDGPFGAESSVFTGNTAGGYGGAFAFDTAPVAHDAANQVFLLNPTIAGNTATGGGGAIDSRHYSQMRLSNAIIAFNSSGIQQDATSLAMIFTSDVYGNGSADFTGLSSPVGTLGNINADPLFVNRSGGDYHLNANSPAVDAGDNGTFAYYASDVQSSPRIQGARIDMGAYERANSGTFLLQFDRNVTDMTAPGVLPNQPVVRLVDGNGVTLTGFSGSVTIALKAGYGTTGATLGGTTTVPLVNGVATFTNLSIDKGGTDYVLTASIPGHGGADSNTFVVMTTIVRVSPAGSDRNDGSSWALAKRTLQTAMDQTAANGSVWIKAGYYLGTHQLNRNFSVLGGFAGTETTAAQRNPKSNVVTIDAYGLGSVFIAYGVSTDTPTYDGMTFQNGIGYGGGIEVSNGSPTISNNIFTNGNAVFGGGLLIFGGSGNVNHNKFINNVSALGGSGIYFSNCTVTASDNLFTGNSNLQQDGAAITQDGGNNVIINNTIVGNPGTGGAVALHAGGATLVNNIIAFNGSGVSRGFGGTDPVVEHNNDVYGNTDFNYSNLTAGTGDIASNPLFVNAAAGDYRLRGDSPAVDAGDDSVAPAGDVDLNGAARKQGTHVDMGAYELTPGGYVFADASRALRIAGGLVKSTSADVTRLNVENTTTSLNKIDARDALRLLRKVTGLDTNP